MKKNICVFCGSAEGKKPEYMELAKNFGIELMNRKMGLVYGGASVGLMGAVADGLLNSGGEVYGVIPQHLVDYEVAHKNLTKLYVVSTMHERKKKMYDLSDVFVAIPGGFGTLDELFEILTWAQLELHDKPCYILNVNGFYDHLLSHVKKANTEGFVSNKHLELLKVVGSLDELFDAILLPYTQ
jgi:uncharacterized protein (TIGR00730 family)